MSDIYNYINTQGIIVPDTQDVLNDVRTEWKQLFGESLSTEEGTPQGRIIELIATERKQSVASLAFVANQLNPQVATGTFLDAQGNFFGVERGASRNTIVMNVKMTGVPSAQATGSITIENYELLTDEDEVFIANISYNVVVGDSNSDTASLLADIINTDSSSVVIATANGDSVELVQKPSATITYKSPLTFKTTNDEAISTSGEYLNGGVVIIPNGTLASDTSGNIYILSGDKTLDSTGVAYGDFSCQKQGSIPCPPHTLTNCSIQPIEGWETIDNANAGNIGYEQESDADYRVRIDLSKSKYSTSMVNSLISELYEIEGLISCYVYENYDNFTKTNENDSIVPVGESISPHSIFVVVYGASPTFNNDVANAIITKKSGGCGLVASSVYPQNVVNAQVRNGDGTYNITFNTPQAIPVYININVKNISYSGSDLVNDVKNVISQYFSSNIQSTNKIDIGKNISAFDIGCVVSSQLGVYVASCFIGTSENPNSVDEISISINQIGSVDINNIQVGIIE